MYKALSALLIYTSGDAIIEMKRGQRENRAGLDLILEKADIRQGYTGITLNYDLGKLARRSAPYNCRGK